ncbi:MAG: MogA/MoaB family molybdenum cofactor biosynthesis protein [Candidatus Omnitrophica bacterium]|nr:MogA/MoaB family molybdenum cofactor biosynthesis protein [Candidatus Omnitrophota bacterium]
MQNQYAAAILTISDTRSCGGCDDITGQKVKELIVAYSFEVKAYEVIPDDPLRIRDRLIYFCDDLKCDVVLTNGGTGFSPRDFTPEVTKEIIEKEIPGLAEAMRALGGQKTKRAYLSRAVCGIRGRSLIINLPGSPRGAEESLEVVVDLIDHAIKMIRGEGH